VRLLLVDDDEQVREILTDMLSLTDNCEVVPVCDAREALRLVSESPVDVIITDLGMPGMSGIELAEKVHEIYPRLPVGLVTGWGSQLNEEEIAQQGITALLCKPFRLKDVQALVAKLSSAASQ
jgi:DNA-binding NtrC family response regulator